MKRITKISIYVWMILTLIVYTLDCLKVIPSSLAEDICLVFGMIALIILLLDAAISTIKKEE